MREMIATCEPHEASQSPAYSSLLGGHPATAATRVGMFTRTQALSTTTYPHPHNSTMSSSDSSHATKGTSASSRAQESTPPTTPPNTPPPPPPGPLPPLGPPHPMA
ncbi:hypothetical protein GY45DRAFT_1364967, partial [Cubamyces sp. BRFM 1775]